MISIDDFSSRFILTQLPSNKRKSSSGFRPNEKTRSAAVLVPIVEHHGELALLLTTRAKHLRHHPGQISFPGGNRDPEDASLVDTALRECFEEIGIEPAFINPLGWLPSHHTISNFTIYPLVAIIRNGYSLTINEDEVDEAFLVPLQHLVQRKHHTVVKANVARRHHEVHFIQWHHHWIWGATAAIIDKLIAHIE